MSCMKSIHFPPPVADDMVRAILDNRKTVTQRVAFPGKDLHEFPREEYPDGWWFRGRAYRTWDSAMRESHGVMSLCKYRPGDILYVRETWQYAYDLDGNEQPIEGTGRYLYAADRGPEPFGFWVNPDGTHRDSMPWRPSIHMPREAARIFLRVTDVRIERLWDITELDILEKEGVTIDFPQPKPSYMSLAYTETILKPAVKKAFAELWNSTIKKTDRALYGWDANPWVWVIKFERISKGEAFV